MMKTLIALLALAAGLLAPPAAAHLGEPTIKRLRFPESRPEQPWFVVDNVGLLALGDDWRWLCDEAITPVPGLEDLAPLDADGRIWLAATRGGLRRTTDGGCTFEAVPAFTGHAVGHLAPHPDRPGEALVGTVTIGGPPNDIWRTTDGGETWTPAGLPTSGRIRGLLRAEADPEVVYALHTTGAARSDDGGRTFTPIALAPPPAEGEIEVSGTDIALLTTDPHDPRTVWSALVRFPESSLLRSRDGGASWEAVARFPDDPRSLVIAPDTGHLLLAMALEGLRRSTDGGATWQVVFLPEPNAWLDCLTWAPDGALWACVRRNAPYLAARSEDFGETWTGRFASDYTDIVGGWRCPAESATAAACASACDRARQDCSAPEPDAGPPPDAGPGAAPPDVGEAAAPRSDDGCRATPGAPPGAPIAPLLLLAGLARPRRGGPT